MSNKVRINPKNPKYEGCYQHVAVDGTITYWVKKRINKQVWHKVGHAHDGISEAYVKNFRGALTTENIHHIMPTPHDRKALQKGEVEVQIPTVDEAWDEHFVPWANRSCKPNTNGVRASQYKNHIKPHIGDNRLDELTVAKLDKLKDDWTKAGLQLPTQKQVWLTVTTFVNTIKRLGVFNATAALDIPKKINAKRRRKRFLSELQIEDLLTELKDMDRTVWQQCCIMAYAGLRTDEVIKLRVMDIKLDDGRIDTDDIKSSTNQAKSDWVPIDDCLHPILKEAVQGLPVNASTPIFPQWFNYDVWHKACDKFGLNDGIDSKDRVNRLTPYCLRHSFASNLLKSGADIKQVQKLMRHDRLESTMHYLHVDDEGKTDALKLRSERRKKLLAERNWETLRVIDGGVE